METRTLVSECVGTLLLVFFAVGSLVLAGDFINALGVALAFGFTLIALGYVFGRISGCHVNPAVTLGVLLARRIDLKTAIEYWVAQLVGGIIGAAVLYLLANQVPGLKTDGAFGTNGYNARSPVDLNTGGAFLAEVMLTFLLVFVYLTVTRGVRMVDFEPIPVGLTLAAVELIGIPLTWASVNPARSLGPALFAGGGALSQLWLFLVAPLLGGALAAVVHEFTHPHPPGGPGERERAAGPGPLGPWLRDMVKGRGGRTRGPAGAGTRGGQDVSGTGGARPGDPGAGGEAKGPG
jgi:aquaporin Z